MEQSEPQGDILDLSYDYYGRRLATVGSDRTVKIWEADYAAGSAQAWRCTASWDAHDAPILRVVWAHPEFSPSLIATCSMDRRVILWEDRDRGEGRWPAIAKLMDSRDEVRGVAFAPVHVGLRLATVSADGFLRVYEAPDPANLCQWPPIAEFLGAVGGDTLDNEPIVSATLLGSSSTLPPAPGLGLYTGLGALCWNPSPVDPAELVVGCDDGLARIWRYSTDSGGWVLKAILTGHQMKLHDVAWAPNPGRQFHLIASAGKDGAISIWKLDLKDEPDPRGAQPPQRIPAMVRLEEQPNTPAWRVQWNVTGTVLSASWESGAVKLYHSRHHEVGTWECCGTLQTDS